MAPLAHEVNAYLHTKVVSNKDLEIEVKTTEKGKLGTLLVSKGNVEWVSSRHSVTKRRLRWTDFAELMEVHGKEVKGSKSRK